MTFEFNIRIRIPGRVMKIKLNAAFIFYPIFIPLNQHFGEILNLGLRICCIAFVCQFSLHFLIPRPLAARSFIKLIRRLPAPIAYSPEKANLKSNFRQFSYII